MLVTFAFAAQPALAQTYDPDYPVCMESYTIGGRSIGCGYTTMAQCKASASGIAAQCIVNPFFGWTPDKRSGIPYRGKPRNTEPRIR
jgi:hypothetical protein